MQDLLAKLLSPDNAERQFATTNLENSVQSNPNQTLKQICGMVKCIDDAVSTLALVIIKQYYLTPKDLSIQPVCITLSQSELEQLLSHLTQCLNTNKPQSFNRKLIDILANISDSLNKNSELLQFLSSLESKVFTMYGIQILVQRFLNDTFAHQHSASFLQILSQGLNISQTLEVRIAALKAACEFLLAINQDKVIHQFVSLLPVLINTLVEALKHDEDSGNEVLSSLIDLASGHAEIWEASIEELIEIASQIADTGAGFEEGTRQQAVELVCTLAEGIPKIMRKSHKLENKFIPILFQMISSPQYSNENEQQDWNKDTTQSQIADISKKDPHSVGKTALTQIGDILGEKVFMKMTASLMHQGIANDDWKVRSGCILASGIASQSCKDFYSKNLENVIHTLAPFLNDPHHRNRFAAITSLSFVCQSTSPKFQKIANVEYLEKLCTILNEDPFTKNRLQATSGMIDFCRGIINSTEDDEQQNQGQEQDDSKLKKSQQSLTSKKQLNLQNKRGTNIIKSVADPLIKAIALSLNIAFQKSLTRLQQELLNLLSMIASIIDSAIQPYFFQLSTGITKIYELAQKNTPQDKSVRSKVITTLASMISALSDIQDNAQHQQIKVYAINFLNMILSIKESNKSEEKDKIKDSDPQLIAITQAFIHLCDFLKKQISPFLPKILPSLLNDLELNIDFKVQNAEVEALMKKNSSSNDSSSQTPQSNQNNDTATASKTVQIKGMEESIKMSLNTHAFQQKQEAASALLSLCQSLGKNLGNENAENILLIVTKYLNFEYSPKIRKSTTKTLKFLLEVPQNEQERRLVFVNIIYPKLKAVLDYAVNKNNLKDSKLLFKQISRCIQTFPTLIDENKDDVKPLDQQTIQEMYKIMTNSFNAVNKINQQLINSTKGDMDQEDAQELLQEIDENSKVISYIMDLSGNLLKRYGNKIDAIMTTSGLIDLFLEPVFQKIPSSKTLLDPLCFLGETMNYSSLQTFEALAAKIIARLFEILTEFGEQDIDVQQNISFIMGVIANRANEAQFKPMAQQVIFQLVKMITDINAMTTDERIIATETAVGALGKVILFQTQSEFLNDEIVKNMYLNYLPLKAEEQEALNAHELFFSAIINSHSIVQKNRKECSEVVERMVELCQGTGQEEGNELKDEIYTEKTKEQLMKCHEILGK